MAETSQAQAERKADEVRRLRSALEEATQRSEAQRAGADAVAEENRSRRERAQLQHQQGQQQQQQPPPQEEEAASEPGSEDAMKAASSEGGNNDDDDLFGDEDDDWNGATGSDGDGKKHHAATANGCAEDAHDAPGDDASLSMGSSDALAIRDPPATTVDFKPLSPASEEATAAAAAAREATQRSELESRIRREVQAVAEEEAADANYRRQLQTAQAEAAYVAFAP